MCRRPLVFLEDLIFWLEAAYQVNQPPLVGVVRLVHAMMGEVVSDADAEDLLYQDILIRRSRAGQHFDVSKSWAEDLPLEHILHVLLRDN